MASDDNAGNAGNAGGTPAWFSLESVILQKELAAGAGFVFGPDGSEGSNR